MQLTQILSSSKNRFAFFLWVLTTVFSPSLSLAGLVGVSLGATYPTPLGFNFETLDHSAGVQAETWMELGLLDPSLMNLHFAVGYEPFNIRGQSINIHMLQAFAGVQFHNGTYGASFLPFITVDLGAVYDWMTFSGVAGASNSAYAFATQVTPGFDLPVYGPFGVNLSMPFKLFFFSRPLVLWDAILGVRFKL